MRFDEHDPSDRGSAENSAPPEPAPLDAAESTWDPWLWALYLREVAEQRPPALH
jgi:hypothetical protein